MDSSRSSPEAGRDLWEAQLDAVPFAFVDVETTGLDHTADRVVQICVERVVGANRVGRLASLVRTERGGAEEIHGLSIDDRRDAPCFAELADRVGELLLDAILVAHAAEHDVAFLRAELARLGRSWQPSHVLDTLPLARHAFTLERYGLVPLSAALQIDNPHPHRADNDVQVLRALWRQLLAELQPKSARELAERCAPRADLPQILAEVERALSRDEPLQVHYRASRRAAQWLDFRVTSLRRELDPPLVLGYLQHTRGRRELQASRILAIRRPGDGRSDRDG